MNERSTYGPEAPGVSRVHGLLGFPCARADQRGRLSSTSSSYFRARATSARSRRASSTACPRAGSPFARRGPKARSFRYFTDFWIERPPEHAEQIVIHALLQSPSVVGAYTFTAQPGDETVIDVEVALFPRVELTAFGIAPLTSMFLFDGSNRTRFDDYRNAVHDSDGLQIVNGRGERLWRPLANPRMVRRDHGFSTTARRASAWCSASARSPEYQDAEAQYERRPSLWVEPRAEWGAGHVELVEIPLHREINDNIVAYWQPARADRGGPERRVFLSAAFHGRAARRLARARRRDARRAVVERRRPALVRHRFQGRRRHSRRPRARGLELGRRGVRAARPGRAADRRLPRHVRARSAAREHHRAAHAARPRTASRGARPGCTGGLDDDASVRLGAAVRRARHAGAEPAALRARRGGCVAVVPHDARAARDVRRRARAHGVRDARDDRRRVRRHRVRAAVGDGRVVRDHVRLDRADRGGGRLGRAVRRRAPAREGRDSEASSARRS